ncbi:MAG: hypothetical protein ACKO0M_15250 [Cyanobium sp.]
MGCSRPFRAPRPVLLLCLLLWLGTVSGLPARGRDNLEAYQRRLEELFWRLDRNGDGRLVRDEVRANPYLRRHFERLDRSGKGFLVPADLVPQERLR